MSKIAYIFNTFPNASETFLAREIAALREMGLPIEIFALEAGPGARKITKPNALFRASPHGFWHVVGQNLAREIAYEGFTHIHGAWANHVAQIAWSASQTLDLPWSFSAHARDLWVEGGDLTAKIRGASAAFCCSRRGFEFLQGIAPDEDSRAKIRFAPHGLDLAHWPFRTWEMPEEAGEIRILGVGRLVGKKGWPLLLTAMQFLPLGRRTARLQIIGEGPLHARLERQIGGISRVKIEILGARDIGFVRHRMKTAHVLVLPSVFDASGDRDGLANVLLEAAALGTPIVTTTAGSARDLVDETTGVLLHGATPRELARGISEVLESASRTRKRCEAARKRVETDFCVAQNARILWKFFTAL